MSEFKIFKTLFCFTDAERAAISLRSRQGSQLDNSMTDVDSGIQEKNQAPLTLTKPTEREINRRRTDTLISLLLICPISFCVIGSFTTRIPLYFWLWFGGLDNYREMHWSAVWASILLGLLVAFELTCDIHDWFINFMTEIEKPKEEKP